MERRQALLGTAEKLPKDSEESLTSRDRGRPPSGGTESLWTLRWREVDSNSWSRFEKTPSKNAPQGSVSFGRREPHHSERSLADDEQSRFADRRQRFGRA